MRQVFEAAGALSVDRLAQAFDATGDCAAVLRPDGTLLKVNAAGAAVLMADPDTAVGSNWCDIWPSQFRASVRDALGSAARGGRATVRTSLPASDARSRWWQSTIIPVPGLDCDAACLLAISREVTAEVEAVSALRKFTRLQDALAKATSEIVWHLDTATGCTQRRGYYAFTGWQDDPSDPDGWLAGVHPEDQARAKSAADQAEAAPGLVTIEYRLRHKTDAWRWVQDSGVPIFDEDGAVTDWVGIITDIHDRKSAEQALQKSEGRLRLALDATGLCTWEIDLITGQQDWSSAMFDFLGLPEGTPAGRDAFLSRVHPEDRARVETDLIGAASGGGPKRVISFRVDRARSVRWIEAHERTILDRDGRPVRRVGTLQDTTDRKEAEDETWRVAHTDALTGVANRALFQARLDRCIADASQSGGSVGLFLVDLDRFKEVNDALGHDAGDAMLCAVAQRLSRSVDAAATVARIGGDEFGVIAPNAAGVASLEGLASRLLAALAEPLTYAGREVDCSSSIGWAAYPDQDARPSTLLKNADIALYAAKAAGRGRTRPYAPAMRHEMERRVSVLRSARDALSQDAVLPFYQPKVSLKTGRLVGFEALLRWKDGTRIRSPADIQEALDHPELSIVLGSRILTRAVEDMAAWAEAGVPFGHMAVNVATAQVQDSGFTGQILTLLGSARLQPSRIEVEVTERVLLGNGTGAIGSTLCKLHEAGVGIALDDFGTGYASLTHLTKFPVTVVKIDRSFVASLDQDRHAPAIVKGIIELSQNIGAVVVAEGIETIAQLRFLTDLGCDLGQGYLFGKAISGTRVPAFVKGWSGWSLPNCSTGRPAAAKRNRNGEGRAQRLSGTVSLDAVART